MRLGLSSLWLLSLAACQFSPSVSPPDTGGFGFPDANTRDATTASDMGGRDAVFPDGSNPTDMGQPDAATTDTGNPRDTGNPVDTGPGDDVGMPIDMGEREDMGGPDVGAPDTGPRDVGIDAGQPDFGRFDMGQPDLGPPDLGQPDLGPPDTGVDAGQPDTGVVSVFPYQPSNLMFPAASYAPPAQDTFITGDCIINTGPSASVGGACGPNTTLIQENVGGTNIAIWVHDNFTVSRTGNGGTIGVTGLHPLLILVHGDAIVEGIIDGAGGVTGLNLPGPGAETYCAAQNEPEIGTSGNGSGGGGFGTEGGRGGRRSGGSRPEGGDTDGNATLIPLRGGCHGRFQSIPNANFGGRGGGGIQISAAGEVDVTGFAIIDISGGGGQGGGSTTRGGGGGGSGGGLLLEADILNIRPGALILAGGGGGGGGGANGFGNDGDRGGNQLGASTVAPGGNGGVSDAGDGGNGAIRNTAAEDGDGARGGGANASAGGGGGGAGRIRLNAHTLCSTIFLPTAPTSSGGQTPCVGF